MKQFRTKAEALEVVGGLSKTSKMPCPSYGLPACECPTGMILAEVEGSTCNGCYALKGRCAMPNSVNAQYRRMESLTNEDWVAAMVFLILPLEVFRWHDTGDLLGQWHLDLIIAVCEATPKVKHWLPTREYRLIKDNLHRIPDNLVVRVSAPMVDGAAPSFKNTSTVHRDLPAIGTACPAIDNGGKCGDCRMCWDKRRRNISYNYH